MRELPSLRLDLPRQGTQDRTHQLHLPRRRQLDEPDHQGDLQAGGERRHPAVLHGQPEAHAHLLGPSSHQRFAGDESPHRPAARADGDARVPREKANRHRPRRRRAHRHVEPRPAARAVHARHVCGDELRCHQLQRAQEPCDGGAAARHLLQYGRGRSARGFLRVWRQHDRTGRVGTLRRA